MLRLSAHGGARELIFEKTSTCACSFYRSSSKKYTWLQYKKRQIQVPGTTFSNFSDEVEMEGGHANCGRFATLTGVHQGAHICVANYGLMEKFGAGAELRNTIQKKMRGRGGSSCRFDCSHLFFVGIATQVLWPCMT